MEYVEFEEWKKFKKEKNYKESIDILIDEIATNLVRVHNHYSDVKYDEKKELGIAFNYLDYGKNSKNKSINDMKLFIDFCGELSLLDRAYCDILEDSAWGTFKDLLKDVEILREKAIKEIDKDLKSQVPMDRLLCGDVGFGKTEVAFRAMFKAIANNKQVFYLCPTTILSKQQYQSAIKRFKDYPVNIALLNRFTSAKDTKRILQELSEGKLDIIFGTHRLLSDDVKFKKLGLLIVDEEQRFGVTHKEKIKKYKTDVNVLTLSATPIPRTLKMAMSGLRDLSVIDTAPVNRYPIQTYVLAQNNQIIKEAIYKEMAREGQVFVLFNRVENLETKKAQLQKLVPDAKIAIAHGQMNKNELEDVMIQFNNREYDVLLCTTIIETGIDIPTVNTLIIIDADHFGLSQLYQIRGRIGRSDKLAYAYLTYDGGKVLTEDAYKRLEAIKEFRELGSGFKIAMRDLEIRGAGNILGKEQHGHMQKVGYDMYVRLLEEVTKELSGAKTQNQKEIKMELVLDAYISENYISSQEERIVFYNKISQISSAEEFRQVQEQLVESNGDMPVEVENLCKIAYLKNLAGELNVQKIKINSVDCAVYLYKSEEIIEHFLKNVDREVLRGNGIIHPELWKKSTC